MPCAWRELRARSRVTGAVALGTRPARSALEARNGSLCATAGILRDTPESARSVLNSAARSPIKEHLMTFPTNESREGTATSDQRRRGESEHVRTGRGAEAIAAAIVDNLRYSQATLPGLATRQDWYMALALTVRDRLMAQIAQRQAMSSRPTPPSGSLTSRQSFWWARISATA